MHSILNRLTDKIVTKKGVWVTISIWIIAIVILSVVAPNSKQYSVNNVSDLYPDKSPSVIAQNKLDEYFNDEDGLPGIFVFESEKGVVHLEELTNFTEAFHEVEIPYVKSMIPLHFLPPEATNSFFAEDETAAFLPILFEKNMTSKEIKVALEEIMPLIEKHTNLDVHMTGPAGIAVDATDLFSRADLVLLFSTIGIILILLIVTYRSPLLALIPLLAAIFVYGLADRILGLLGLSGVELANQSLSIMMILLFAIVIDYSLFIFSRFREELKSTEDKYEAMRRAMREIGIPIFYSGSTIFLAMVVLFLASFGDYKNFAPIFTTTILVVMIGAITLIPSLFAIFGRRSFWPKIPRVGDNSVKSTSMWAQIGKLVSNKPIASVISISVILLVFSINIFGLNFEYNTLKSFPDDMPSREGYHILENKFEKGTLAPTDVIFEANDPLTEEGQNSIKETLEKQTLVSSVRIANISEDEKVAHFEMTFSDDPYGVPAMDSLEDMMKNSKGIMSTAKVKGEFHFAGETAASVDNRNVNYRDLIVIVLIETFLIFAMLMLLTRSITISGIMIGTILLSFLAALGLGVFLTEYIFGVSSISNRIPIYAFVFLVSLGIDYNIFLVSRFLEEKKHHPVKKAVELAVTNTGGVISSAGIILAATFAVLITQPVQDLSLFGFIVALGILMDTFLIRGVLLPGLLILLEKNEHLRIVWRRRS